MGKAAAIYAEALYGLAEEVKKESDWKEQLEALNTLWRETPEILRFFARTQVSKQDKKTVLKESLGANVDTTIVNTLCLLVDKDRMALFPDMIEEYRHHYNRIHNIAEGIVYSVYPLDKTQLQNLNRDFSERRKQTVELTNRIDPTLISGIKVSLENTIIDGSMKARIANLKTELVKGSR